MEKTLVILKPDCVQRALMGRVIQRFEEKGLKITALQMKVLPRDTIEQHYAEHVRKPFFGELCDFMTSGPAVLLMVEGPRAVSVTRRLVGSTAGWESEAGTIRGDFGLSNQYNLIHASDSDASAKREIELFFGGPGEEYTAARERWW